MNHGTCQNCQYWAPPKLFRDGRDGNGQLWIDELGQCFNERLRKIYNARRPHEAKQSLDDDACVTPDHADLMTGPGFGCVHFKEKN